MMFRIVCTIFMLEICLRFGIVFGQDEQATPLGSLVPQIDQKSFKLKSSGQQYTLVIDLPNGSKRNDNVMLRAPNTSEQELYVAGEITNYYPGALIVITYQAGKNGYTAHYKYVAFGIDSLSLGPNALKSAVG